MTTGNRPVSKGKQPAGKSGSGKSQIGKNQTGGVKNSNPGTRAGTIARPGWRRYLPLILGLVLVAGMIWLWLNREAGLSGRVESVESRNPLRNARIQLDDQVPVTPNDLTGGFNFNRLRAGEHRLKVEANGYHPQTLSFKLAAGELKKLTIQLEALPAADPFAGLLTLIGTRGGNGVSVLAPEGRRLQTISLPGLPSDGVANGKRLFVALNDKDQIAVVDIRAGRVSQKIQLPKFSGPQRLLLTPGRQLLVLNQVAANLTVIGLDDLTIQRAIPLPVPASDMALGPDSSTVWLAGAQGLLPVNYAAGNVGDPIALPASTSPRLSLHPLLGQLMHVDGRLLTLVDPLSRQLKPVAFHHDLAQVAVIDRDRLLLAGGESVFVYDLTRGSYTGSPLSFGAGKITDLGRAGDAWLLALHDPDKVLLIRPEALQDPRPAQVEGTPQFVLSHTL